MSSVLQCAAQAVLLLFFCVGMVSNSFAQAPDSVLNKTVNPLVLPDSLPPNLDSNSLDSLAQLRDSMQNSLLLNNTANALPISKDAIQDEVTYSAKDSMRLDAINEIVYLYGQAEVKYTSISIKGGKIMFDMANDIVIAEGTPDSLGRESQLPVFTEGNNEPITAKKMRYNFVTKKGMVYNATSNQAGGLVRSSVTKIVTARDSIKDDVDVLYGRDAIYTTCDHPTPHYGLRSSRQKIIPEKVVIVGPSNIEIMNIPTPLWLPFGFFPLAQGQSSGLIFPKDYEYSESWGYGLRNVGWYFGMGDNWDLRVLSDVYTRGSWGIKGIARYKKRYVANGNLELGYSKRVSGDPIADGTTPQVSTYLRWSHNQDQKYNPTITFRGNLNIQTNGYQNLNNNDANNVLNSELTSNVYLTKTFPNSPFSLNASFGHSQNVNTGAITINFPTVDVTMRRIFPFKREVQTGGERWYEKIGVNYTGKVQNTITGYDSLIFQPSELDFSYGARHSVPVSMNFKVLKYINVSPFVNYTERWYLETLQKTFDDNLIINVDTTFDAEGNPLTVRVDTTFGQVNELTQSGFRSLREFSTGVSFNTQLFGMLNIRRGPIRAVRHTLKPSVSFTYTPDYTSDFWGYWDEVQTDTRYPNEVDQYNIFQGGLFGQATTGGARSMSYSLNSIFEAKVVNRRDTINPLQKIRLLNSLNFNSSYNFAADSLKMNVINMSGAATILKNINLSFGATFDPLAANEQTNGRIDTYEWAANNRIARFTSGRLNLNSRLDSEFFKRVFGKQQPEAAKGGNNNDGDERDNGRSTTSSRSSGFLKSINVNYSFGVSRRYFSGVDSIYVTQNNLRLSGGTINLTSKWRVTIGGIGYDFVNKSLTYPDFQFYRDLHCWEMGFSWQPQRGTYSFYIRVKQPSKLDFLNVPYNRNNYDPLGGF